MGDPGGIGAEVLAPIVKRAVEAGPEWVAKAGFVLDIFGVPEVLERAAGVRMPVVIDPNASIGSSWTSWAQGRPTAEGGVAPITVHAVARGTNWASRPDAQNGRVSFECVEKAIALAKELKAQDAPVAVVTGPISKEAWSLAGENRYPGHTELFADRFGVQNFGMMFHAEATTDGRPGLNVILATVHVPLAQVRDKLMSGGVEGLVRRIRLAHDGMVSVGVAKPRIAVAGLNPHAGESGLLGTEERELIGPAVVEARAQGMDVYGPIPGDTVFIDALTRSKEDRRAPKYDVVVAMYHDQGLAPLKTLAWDRAVNRTVGLPIPRTSPDHGTGFDIAGKGVANPGSMMSAVRLARVLAQAEQAGA